VNKQLEQKLKDLPKTPGVYFHKNARGEIIYIGKAAVLRNRVRQYFQTSRNRDPKTEALVAEIADTEWTEVETELDALFLEAELIRRYMPPYNILLRDDKSLAYVRISYKSDHPTVTLSRRPLDDGAEYLGPYFSAFAVRRALTYLRKAFPYSTHSHEVPKRACLQYHLGLCPGLEAGKTPIKEYRANLKRLMRYLRGERKQLMIQIEKDMKAAAKAKDFENAAKFRNQLFALKSLTRQIVFSDREFLDISKDKGLTELTELLSLSEIPRRIEGYDISHMQGTDNVASMVVFVSGVPDKAAYRKFKLRIPGNDDFAHMNEAISRRLGEKNRTDWGLPNLFLIDGGKGQLSSAIKARDEAGQTIPMIGLAKREEQIVVSRQSSIASLNLEYLKSLGGFMTENDDFFIVDLPKNSHAVKLLQRIRDESHRFAVSYHSTLKRKRQTKYQQLVQQPAKN
jgi:excinuclease ABC subunit C